MKKKTTNLKTGLAWSRDYRVTVLKPDGWIDHDQFIHLKINKDEFCVRAANSKIESDFMIDRRTAHKVLKKI